MGKTILIREEGGSGISEEDFINATNGINDSLDNLNDIKLDKIDFNDATNGINLELEDLQNQLDGLVINNNDYTTAGLVYETTFNDATNGINIELNNLDNKIDNLVINNNDYTTAGLVYETTFYDATNGINIELNDLQNQLDNLVINNNDYTTAGLVYETTFNDATDGINIELNDLQNQINNIDTIYNDYTTAGLVTREEVINEINALITQDEVLCYFDSGNLSQASTLETNISFNQTSCYRIRPNTWKMEITFIDIMTTTSSANNGVQPLTLRVYEFIGNGTQRGFNQGNLMYQEIIPSNQPSLFYQGISIDLTDNPITLTPDYRLFVDTRHFGGWNYDNLYVKVYVKYTKIA